MGRLKLILGGAVVLIVAVIVASVAILKSIDFNEYKSEIAQQVKSATGRDLVIAGDLGLEISLSPRVSVDGVTLSNAAWGSRSQMIKLKSFAAQVKLLPLLFGDIHIVELILIEPDILLETDKNGSGNWVFGKAPAQEKSTDQKTETSSTGSLPAVNAVRIEKARFTYKDGVKGEETTIVIDTMQANAEDLDDPLNLLFKGAFNNHIIELSGQLGSPESLINGDPLKVNLTLKAADTVFAISGKIDDPMAGKGLKLALTAQSPNIAKLAEIGGTKVGKVGPFEMVATLSDGDNSYKLGGLNIKIGESDLSGDISVNLAGKVPALNVALTSNLLNTQDITPASLGTKTNKPVEKAEKSDKVVKLFPTDPLPLAALKSINADISFKAKKIIVSDFTLHNFTKDISLKSGKLNVKPGFSMGGGTFGGLVSLDGRKLPARLKIDLTGKDLGLGASLKETGITDLIEDGKTQIRINLSGTGKSVAGIMATLKGQTLLNVGKGKINSKYVNLAGGDLVTQLTGALNPFAKKEDFTPLACMVVNLNFKKGLADYDKNIAIQTDKMNVTSSGEINLAKETLDIGIKPEPRSDAVDLGVNMGGLAGMVRLTGPLSAPGIGVDALGTAKAAVGIASAIATGGISLLVSGLADKAMADDQPCATALGQKTAPKKTSSQSTQKKEQTPNPVGGLLNLFGGNK